MNNLQPAFTLEFNKSSGNIGNAVVTFTTSSGTVGSTYNTGNNFVPHRTTDLLLDSIRSFCDWLLGVNQTVTWDGAPAAFCFPGCYTVSSYGDKFYAYIFLPDNKNIDLNIPNAASVRKVVLSSGELPPGLTGVTDAQKAALDAAAPVLSGANPPLTADGLVQDLENPGAGNPLKRSVSLYSLENFLISSNIRLGADASAEGFSSVAIGASSRTYGDYSVAVGSDSQAYNDGEVSFGGSEIMRDAVGLRSVEVRGWHDGVHTLPRLLLIPEGVYFYTSSGSVPVTSGDVMSYGRGGISFNFGDGPEVGFKSWKLSMRSVEDVKPFVFFGPNDNEDDPDSRLSVIPISYNANDWKSFAAPKSFTVALVAGVPTLCVKLSESEAYKWELTSAGLGPRSAL